jgi:type I restriction enzyme R subunit
VLQQQAANNTKEQFSNSPDLSKEILNAIIEAMVVQAELSTRALNSAEIQEGLKLIMLNQLSYTKSSAHEPRRRNSEGLTSGRLKSLKA